MSSARKEESTEAPVQDNVIEMTEDERRHHPDSKSRDRRVILRLGHPEMRNYFGHISKICRVWVGFSAAYIAAMMIGNYSVGKLAIGRSIFFDVCVIILAIAIHRFDRSIRSYLTSESQAKLVIVAERLFLFLFIAVILGSVMGAVHLITLF